MDDIRPNFKDNTIAYNGNLRDQLGTLHEMLGVEVTDIASNATQYNTKYSVKSEKILEYMSQMTAKLTLTLMEARHAKNQLTPKEQEDYNNIKSLTNVLGNVQDRVNRIIKLSKQADDINNQLNDYGIKLAEEIVEAQEKFRKVRASINAYGFLSDDPKLAYLFDEQSKNLK